MIPTREGLRDRGPQPQRNLQHRRGQREPARKALNAQQMVHFKKTPRVQTKSSRNLFLRLVSTTAGLREDCRPGHQSAERTPGDSDGRWAHTLGAAVRPDRSGLSEPLPSLRPLGAPQ